MELRILFGLGDRPDPVLVGEDRPDLITCGSDQHRDYLFTGPEWKLDGGPGYDDNVPKWHVGSPEGDGSQAHFGPFDPPSPLQYYGPQEGDGYPDRLTFGPGEGSGGNVILGPPDGWGTVLH